VRLRTTPGVTALRVRMCFEGLLKLFIGVTFRASISWMSYAIHGRHRYGPKGSLFNIPAAPTRGVYARCMYVRTPHGALSTCTKNKQPKAFLTLNMSVHCGGSRHPNTPHSVMLANCTDTALQSSLLARRFDMQ
jgi:hypothetical protein